MNQRYILAALASVTMWGTLALLTVMVLRLPPFFILAVAFGVSAVLGLPRIKSWIVPPSVLLLGIYGIFGFHVFYVIALATAPPVEANLIVEAWPLLIVLLSPLFIGGKLKLYHVAGASIAFIGAILIVSGGHLILSSNLYAYLPAIAAAIIWSTYSLLTKRVGNFSSAAIGGFCAAAAILSLALHLAFEQQVQPTIQEWTALVLLGLGPLGGAFYTWDYALKHGDSRIIGALSYLIPLIATLLLVTIGQEPLTATTAFAMVLIIAGSFFGSLDLFRKRPRKDHMQKQN